MNQPSRRSVPALARLGVLLAALLLIGAVSRPAAAADPSAYCYSWEFLNNTGQDADGLRIRLQGVHDITVAYEGPDNPFGLPLQSSGYDAVLDAYRLDFGGGPALDGIMVHVGVCTDRPVLRLGAVGEQTPPFYWSSGGVALQPEPLFLGVSWLWTAPGHLRVGIHNDTPASLVLWSLSLLVADEPLALGDLGEDVLATLPAVAELAPDVVTLPADTSQFFEIPAEALGYLAQGRALLLQAPFSMEDELENGGTQYAQLLLPSSIYLPLILR